MNYSDSMSEADYETICEQIKEGYTSGKFTNGEGINVSWSFSLETWRD